MAKGEEEVELDARIRQLSTRMSELEKRLKPYLTGEELMTLSPTRMVMSPDEHDGETPNAEFLQNLEVLLGEARTMIRGVVSGLLGT